MSEKWKFTVEDFGYSSTTMSVERAVSFANAKLAEWIKDSPVVCAYVSEGQSYGKYQWSERDPSAVATYQGHLIMVEPIVRESEERQLLRELVKSRSLLSRCGVDTEPPATIGSLIDRARKLLESK